MLPRRLLLAALLAAACALPIGAGRPARAQDAPPATPIVEKKSFETANFRTRGGATLTALRIGYQTAGTLNEAGDNAVLITHFFSGNSHAFGRYVADGPAGYWDAIIGPGKPIDTSRFFVVSADTPVNLNTRDPRTITTGPATINPDTGRPYGMDFPVMSIRDFVESQKKLLDSLGVKRLALVAGPSMGALQAIEWATAYPEIVDRVMPVIGTGEVDAWMLGWLNIWASPIRLDPNWRNGDYYGQGREPPTRGLAEALKIVTLQSRDRGSLIQYGRGVPDGQDPGRRMGDGFAVEKFLDEAALARARLSDANAFLYLVRANQLFLNEYTSTEAALSRSQARWLVVPSVTDRVFDIRYGRMLADALAKLGRPVTVAELDGPLGHLEGVTGVANVAEMIRAFLAQPVR
jgi:homoserine O-acetyltransferase